MFLVILLKSTGCGGKEGCFRTFSALSSTSIVPDGRMPFHKTVGTGVKDLGVLKGRFSQYIVFFHKAPPEDASRKTRGSVLWSYVLSGSNSGLSDSIPGTSLHMFHAWQDRILPPGGKDNDPGAPDSRLPVLCNPVMTILLNNEPAYEKTR